MARGSSLRNPKKKVAKEEEDIRIRFNRFIDNVISKGKTSSVRFDPNFLKELEEAGKEAQMVKKAKPVKIVKSKVLTKPAITQSLNLASKLELAATKDAELDVKKWVKGGK